LAYLGYLIWSAGARKRRWACRRSVRRVRVTRIQRVTPREGGFWCAQSMAAAFTFFRHWVTSSCSANMRFIGPSNDVLPLYILQGTLLTSHSLFFSFASSINYVFINNWNWWHFFLSILYSFINKNNYLYCFDWENLVVQYKSCIEDGRINYKTRFIAFEIFFTDIKIQIRE